jgi:protein-S-isoprenylcysteine O-methyltransferase Ste14
MLGTSYAGEGTLAVAPGFAVAAGGVVAVSGLALACWGVIDFRRARTTVDPVHPEKTARLVTDGIYRWTRNPMYLGFVLS